MPRTPHPRMPHHPVTQHSPMLEKSMVIFGVDGKVYHFDFVGGDVVELFTVEALVVKDVFVFRGTHHPAEGAGGLVEIGFGNDIVTERGLGTAGFGERPKAEAGTS